MKNFRNTESTKQLIKKLREGLKIAFVGEVNSGKSSTVNAIRGEEVAEVSIITGFTLTDDPYEVPTLSKAVKIIDTPGLRAPGTDVSIYRGADLVVYFVNAASGWTASNKTDCFILKQIYGSHIVIAISKIDTVFPREDWLKIKHQIERDLGHSSPKILGICSLVAQEIGIEELKNAIARGLEDSQKAFLFNIILRTKSKDCASVIRETMLKVTSLAASGIPIHEIPKFDEEVIQMIQKIIVAYKSSISPLTGEDYEEAELKAKNFYSEFHQEFGWEFEFIKWGTGLLKILGGVSGTTISPVFGTAGGYAAGVFLQTLCYVICAGMIGYRAKKLDVDNVNVSMNEVEKFAKRMVKGMISDRNVENFIRRFTTEL
jgi:small GTP-binding protein